MKKIIIILFSILMFSCFLSVNASAGAFPLTEDDIEGTVGSPLATSITVTLASDLGQQWGIQDSVKFIPELTVEDVETFFINKPLPTGLEIESIDLGNSDYDDLENHDDYDNTELIIQINGIIDQNFDVNGYEDNLIEMSIDPQYLEGYEDIDSLTLHPVYSTGKYIITCQKYTVSFDVQGHGLAPDAQIIQKGFKATKPQDPSENGYIFNGWYSESACLTAYDFETKVNQDITLYAKWDAYEEPPATPDPDPVIEDESEESNPVVIVIEDDTPPTIEEHEVPVTCVD